MENEILHTEIIQRKQKLEQVKAESKQRFLGLEEIIDEVISLIMPWYLFPESQLRPTIINLWGLTGSGKTALVQCMVELLDYRKFYSHIDMGEFESDSASWMKNILTDDLAFFHEKPAVICLDEFQFAKTLDANNNELGKDKLRVIWELLDSGKIEYIPGHSTYYLFKADNCLKRVERLIREKVVLLDGVIVAGMDVFIKIFDGFFFDYNDRDDTRTSETFFLNSDFINGIHNLFDDDDCSKAQIKARIKSSSIEELALFLKEGMHKRPATKTLDLSNALIFVLGNLDEAYSMSYNMNPDISADEFHEATSKITIAEIKRALRKRFRPEQIARLGNNHLIYRSFNNAQFRMLIRRELKRIADFVMRRFGWKISFDDSIVDIVYAEGVFPAQGTRPVLTTVKNLIESRISAMIVSILEYQLDIHAIVWKYNNCQFIYEVTDEHGRLVLKLSDVAKLKLESLRKSVDPQIQAHTAVHEAGHAVLAALTLRIIPAMVLSRTASDAEGFCLINFPKGPFTRETLEKDIIISLGGYVAEKIIFGEDRTSSGVYDDILQASKLANKAIRNYAMGNDPIHLAVRDAQNTDVFFVSEKYSAEAVQIIKTCQRKAEQLLERNKLLLLKIAEYLTVNSKMEEIMIESYVKKYAKEEWVKRDGFIKKEEYYRFDSVIREELDLLQSESLSAQLETLISESQKEHDDIISMTSSKSKGTETKGITLPM